MRNVDLARSLLKASIPFADPARRLKRRLRPYEPNPTHMGFSFDDGLAMLRALREVGVELSGDVLEVGSGWTPVIPLMLHLAGTRSVVLTDLERLFDGTSIALAQRFIQPRLERLAAGLSTDSAVLELRLTGFSPTYFCPWSVERHPADSVDIAMSRAVMEHVPAGDVAGLFRGLRRIVRRGGVMCHSIDNTDHFQHGDGKGSLVDFLRYPTDSLRWRLSQVNIQGRMNRLRHADYLEIAREAGWTIVLEQGRIPPKVLQDVLRMKATGVLAPEFSGYDPRDLATTATLLVARKP
jgi:SAM-dependent methyltransferase